MGAFIEGVYHEHLTAMLDAKAEVAHARIDAATRRAYRSALDAEGDPAPLDLAPSATSLEAIRERIQTGEGDRRQLMADRSWLFNALTALQAKR